MHTKKKPISVVVATALVTTSLAVAPQALAVEDVKVKALDSYVVDEESDYEIRFTLEEDLDSGDDILITFDDEFQIDKNISKSDVKVEGKAPKSISYDSKDRELTITVNESYDEGDDIKIVIRDVITNPDEKGDYRITVETENEDSDYDKVSIVTKGNSSGKSTSTASSFTVSLSDSAAGARTSYTFEADFGNKQLNPDEQFTIEFPSADMLPGILTADDFTINGKTAKRVGVSGSKIYVTTPSNFSKSSTVKVNIGYGAFISNPKTAGTYNLKMMVDGRTATSKDFTVSGSAAYPAPATPTSPTAPAAPQTGTPAAVNTNNTSTVTLGTTAMGVATGVTVSIKNTGAALTRQRDFIELVFPVGYTVPAYIAPANISVNGTAAHFVAVRGQNVLVYPAQDLPASGAATIVISAGANIINPKVKNTYSISVFTSEEKGLLFARAVGVGMPAPAIPAPVPAPAAPAAPATPAAQPSVAVPTNAALFKMNEKSYTLHGKTYQLQVAPYLANGNTTMVPAQFFKEGLALTTQWNNQTVAIISGTKVLRFTVGSNKAKIGNEEHTLTAPVALKDGMPMIPVRFVTDNLGYKVGWDAQTSSVYVYR